MKEANDIILAEDDDDDVMLFEMALKDIGVSYEMRIADTGERLFILLEEKIPYLLFLDIRMPCRDGISCVVEIRRNRAYDKLPIIMYTGSIADGNVEDCYRNGANMYIHKGNSYEHLTEKLKKVFAINWRNYMPYPVRDEFVVA